MASLQRLLQGRQCEGLVERATQLPAADGAREDVHEHCQVDEVVLQAHIGDVGHPHRIGLGDLQADHQIGIARVGMVAVGRAAAAFARLADESQLAHDPAHALAVRGFRFTPELGRHAPIAIGRPRPSDLRDV